VVCVLVCECVCCVWDTLEMVRVCECAAGGIMLCVCVCVYCVWYSLEQVWESECAAGGFVMCVCVFAACGTVSSRFGGLRVQQVALWCVCVCVCV